MKTRIKQRKTRIKQVRKNHDIFCLENTWHQENEVIVLIAEIGAE